MTQHVNGLIEKALEGMLWRLGTWKRLDLGEDVIGGGLGQSGTV